MVTRPMLAVLGTLVAGLALCSLGHVARHERTARALQAMTAATTHHASGSSPQRVPRPDQKPASTGALIALRDGTTLDLNRASAQDLELLPGIGPSLARRIISRRQEHGPFASVDDLGEVSGIGERMLARVRPWLRVDPEPRAGSPRDKPARVMDRTSTPPIRSGPSIEARSQTP